MSGFSPYFRLLCSGNFSIKKSLVFDFKVIAERVRVVDDCFYTSSGNMQ